MLFIIFFPLLKSKVVLCSYNRAHSVVFRAIAFKPDEETSFLVGTDEGVVYLATTQYSSQVPGLYSVLVPVSTKKA
jgi:hypothetical protein